MRRDFDAVRSALKRACRSGITGIGATGLDHAGHSDFFGIHVDAAHEISCGLELELHQQSFAATEPRSNRTTGAVGAAE